MTDKPEWKKALKESNALGWVAFLILVLAVGFGAVFFGSGPPLSKVANPQTANQSSK